MHVHTLISLIEMTAPLHLAAPWDKCGVQLASPVEEITRIGVALDPTADILAAAANAGCQFLLCHHPVTLTPRLPDRLDDFHRILSLSLGHSMWLYSAHTSLDANPAGPVNWLGRALHLQDMQVLEATRRETPTMVRFQTTDAEELPQGLMRCENGYAQAMLWPEDLQHLRPAFRQTARDGVVYEASLNAPERIFGFGCIGKLPSPLAWEDFQALLATVTGNTRIRLAGHTPQLVSTVAYCPGSGADMAKTAFSCGAEVFVTGDLKFHQAQDIRHGLAMDVGHFCLEEIMMRIWSQELENVLGAQQVQVVFFPGIDPFF